MKEINNIRGNIIQNVCVLWKIFKFSWFTKEDFFSDTNSFIYNFSKELPTNMWVNFWTIWKKTRWQNIVMYFDNYFTEIRQWLIENYNIKEDKIEEIEEYYKQWKENVKWIIDNSLLERNYFGFFQPSFLLWTDNNINRISVLSKWKKSDYIQKLNNFNYTMLFKNKINSNSYNTKNVPVYPDYLDDWTTQFNSEDFLENEDEKRLLDNFLDEIYNITVDSALKPHFNKLSEEVKQKNIKEEQKVLYQAFVDLLPNLWFHWHSTYYADNSDMLALPDSYFYQQDSVVLKIFDITFLSRIIGKENINSANIEILKNILRENMKDWNIEYYVIKSSVIKDAKKYNIKYDKETNTYTYFNDNNVETHIQWNEEQSKMNNLLWDNSKYRWKYWLTVWIYTKDEKQINKIIREIGRRYSKEGIIVNLDLFNWSNLFHFNNYLSIWMPNNINYSNYNWLYTYLINDRVNDIKPAPYFWLDYFTKIPIFKDNFKELKKGKHMAIFADTWWGKTIWSQQFVSTILKDKMIAIDPSWTFKNIGKIYPMKVVSVVDMPNPIYINKDFDVYNKIDSNLFYSWIVDFIINIFNIKFLENEENYKQWIRNILLKTCYYYNWQFVIDDILNMVSVLFKYIKNKKNKPDDKEWKAIIDYLYKDNLTLETIPDSFLIEKLWWLIAWIENSKWTPLHKILSKKVDMFQFLWENDKIVFDIEYLDLKQLQRESSSKWNDISFDSKMKSLLFISLIDSIIRYWEVHKKIVEDNNYTYDEKKKTYLLFDEMHFIIRNPNLYPTVESLIRVARNIYFGLFMITQNVSDFTKYDVSLLKNIAVKIFLTSEDLNSYYEEISKYDNKDEKKVNQLRSVKILKAYMEEYKQAEDNKDKSDPTTLWFVVYGKDEVFITYNKLSNYILKHIDIFRT